MKSKGFTLIELIAVLVIMSIITLLATPNIISLMNKGREDDFMADVRTMVSKALAIHKENPAKQTISFSDLDGVEQTDAYGYKYDKVDITFIDPDIPTDNSTEPLERKVTIDIKASKNGKSHCFKNTNTTLDSLDKNSSGETVKVTDCN